MEKKRDITRTLSLVVMIAAIIVMTGWIFDISAFKSIFPAWISMKFSTAVVFLLSGISLYFIVKVRDGEIDTAYIALSITSLLIVLIMGTLLFSQLLGIHTGEEELFMKDTGNLAGTVIPGRPSTPTMISFLLIALAGILTTFNPRELQSKLRVIGIIVGSIGALACTGYIINLPVLYYFINGVNSAMACHTAVLFILLGIGLLCL